MTEPFLKPAEKSENSSSLIFSPVWPRNVVSTPLLDGKVRVETSFDPLTGVGVTVFFDLTRILQGGAAAKASKAGAAAGRSLAPSMAKGAVLGAVKASNPPESSVLETLVEGLKALFYEITGVRIFAEALNPRLP